MATQIRHILIANRGEIAIRIAKTCSQLGIRCTTIFTPEDAQATHSHCGTQSIGVASYLDAAALIALTQKIGADAIHPGYGFLSEDPQFARAAQNAGIIFIGPSPEAMERLGRKDDARKLAVSLNLPVVPGFDDAGADEKSLVAAAGKIGFPLLIKARAGGGGRGIRVVQFQAEFSNALEAARREAKTFFGDDGVILEKLVVEPRHIEVQLLGDHHGNVVHLFERECTLQRRHQKVIEEAPSSSLSPKLRQQILESAVAIGKASKLSNASTAEFLVSPSGEFYFLEVNSRIQVEHPVTEEITGIDLIACQIRIAQGEPLPFAQTEITERGVAIEARIYAENPGKNFMPQVGRVVSFTLPQGVRVDHLLSNGISVTTDYDSMIAKIITTGATRAEALAQMEQALDQLQVRGLNTNRHFLRRLVTSDAVRANKVSVRYIDEHLAELVAQKLIDANTISRAIAYDATRAVDRENRNLNKKFPHDAFVALSPASSVLTYPPDERASETFEVLNSEGEVIQSQISRSIKMLEFQHGVLTGSRVQVDDQEWQVEIVARDTYGTPTKLRFDQVGVDIVDLGSELCFGDEVLSVRSTNAHRTADDSATSDAVRSPLPGRVLRIAVGAGATVKAGELVGSIESMKMEHSIYAPRDGTIETVLVVAGASVREGEVLVSLSPQVSEQT